MRFLAVLIVLGLGLPAVADEAATGREASEAPPGPEAVAAARAIIEATQAGNTLESMAMRLVEQLAPAFERANPGKGDLIQRILQEEFVATFAQHQEQFVDSLIPVYTGNLTLEELEQLRDFYASPLGRKLIEVQPAVAEQAMRMGGMWGQKLGELAVVRAIEKMQAEGLETGI
jgi:hypothetical protein